MVRLRFVDSQIRPYKHRLMFSHYASYLASKNAGILEMLCLKCRAQNASDSSLNVQPVFVIFCNHLNHAFSSKGRIHKVTIRRHDAQQNDTQHNDTRNNCTQMIKNSTLSVTPLSIQCHIAEHHYA
jgi:hypothetical protein